MKSLKSLNGTLLLTVFIVLASLSGLAVAQSAPPVEQKESPQAVAQAPLESSPTETVRSLLPPPQPADEQLEPVIDTSFDRAILEIPAEPLIATGASPSSMYWPCYPYMNPDILYSTGAVHKKWKQWPLPATEYHWGDGDILNGFVHTTSDWEWDYMFRGFIEFDLAYLPDDACIEAVELVGFCFETYSTNTTEIRRLTQRPIYGGDLQTLYNNIGQGYKYTECITCMRSTGFHYVPLGSAAVQHVADARSQNWFALGLTELGENNGPGRWFGHEVGLQPYLRITLTMVPEPPLAIYTSVDQPCPGQVYVIYGYEAPFATQYRLYENGALIYEGSATSVQISRSSGSYSYRVRGGNYCSWGDLGPTCSVQIKQIPSIPDTPTASTVEPCADSTYAISWSAVVGATSYRLYENAGLIYEGSAISQQLAHSSGTYNYEVQAGNNCGYSTSSGMRQVLIKQIPLTPGTPTASPLAPCADSIYTISWGAVAGATSYRLYEGASLIYEGPATSQQLSDTSTTHSYQVRAGNDCGYSASSGTCIVQIKSIPSMPVILQVSPANPCANSTYTVSWSTVGDAAGYRLYENTTLVYEGTDTSQQFSHLPGSYDYWVTAGNECGFSDSAGMLEIQIMEVPSSPEAPTASETAPCAGDNYIIDWSSVTGAISYTLYENATPIYTGSGTSVQLAHSSGTYAYNVEASNHCGTSSPSGDVVVTVMTSPLAPMAPVASDTIPCEDSTYTITWSQVTGADSYRLYQNTVPVYEGSNRYWDVVNQEGAYEYVVKAWNKCGWGPGSSSENVLVVPCCCSGPTGNVDFDQAGVVDIGDLTKLISFLFIPPYPEPVCMEEANVDGTTDGVVDIGDLTALISYLFIPPYPTPAECQKPL